jgi:hypothetical protein
MTAGNTRLAQPPSAVSFFFSSTSKCEEHPALRSSNLKENADPKAGVKASI